MDDVKGPPIRPRQLAVTNGKMELKIVGDGSVDAGQRGMPGCPHECMRPMVFRTR
jgi:hypothetical protein